MILQAIFKRLIHIQEVILALSLMALVCLPIALSDLVRDAALSLLLPLTLIGTIIAWLLSVWNVRKLFSGIALLIFGPLTLYIRIGQMGDSLFEFIKQLLDLVFTSINSLFTKTPLDLSIFLSSRNELIQRSLALGGRLSLWLTGFSHGIQIEDPVIRTLMWSMTLWLIAVWAGWQIFHNKRFMAGMLPSTVLLVFVLDYTGNEKTILWFHLALLLFLFGLTNYHNLQTRWITSHTDYSESTSFDTLLLVGTLTVALVSTSFLVSTFSIKDIFDDFRKERAGSNESRADALGLKSATEKIRVTGFGNGLPRSFLLSAGPEISKQLAMTISTGELPPMSQNAHPIVPRHYWRTLTYSIYTGSGWTNPSVLTEDISTNQNLIEASNPNENIIQLEVTFPNDANERLYWTGTLVSADVPFKAAWNHKAQDKSLLDNDLLAALAPVDSYNAESILLNVNTHELRNSPNVYPAWVRKQFLALPDSVPERVLALARDLTASEPNPFDRALAIQNYLRAFPYTLDISTPPAGRDVADYFLFDLKQGYCDYYATSMTVLARAAGLPARLVVGYANGFYDVEGAQYIVTENYAHSWVEIYFANIGWVEFEPTASQPTTFYEEINNTATLAETGLPTGASFKERFALSFQGTLKNIWFPVLFIFSCGLLWVGFDALRLARIDPSRAIQLLYKRLRRLARTITRYASKEQTANSYAFTLIQDLSSFENSSLLRKWLMPSHNEIDQLTELFSHSLFAPDPPTRTDANSAIRIWSRLRWRLMLANVLKICKRSTSVIASRVQHG